MGRQKASWMILSLMTLLVQGCGVNKISYYSSNKPELKIEQFFSGKTKGYGLVQKIGGDVQRRFVVDMHGHWADGKGVLDEKFVFDDGEHQQRQWLLKVIDAQHFEATAADVEGVAHGEQLGNAIRMQYVLKIPYHGRTIDVSMDDWLYRVDDHVVMNSATMKKFGLPVGRVTASFFKE